VLHQAGGATIDGASYVLDNAGNRTSKQNLMNGATEGYTYDSIYQLTGVQQGGNTTKSYTYDKVGNRLSSITSAVDQYNSSNELTSDATYTYQYDNNGNMSSKTDANAATTGYTWDFENRLSSVALPGTGGTVSFRYDPFGRRIQKSSGSGTTLYAYDGASIAAEYDGTGSVAAEYVQGAGIDEPLAMSRAGTIAYYHADGLGSITSLTDGAGLVAQVRPSFGLTWGCVSLTIDRNVRDAEEFSEKLRYIHRNPVKRGLVERPDEWPWSSFRHYAYREVGVVEIELEWTARDRERRTHAGRERIFEQVLERVRRSYGLYVYGCV